MQTRACRHPCKVSGRGYDLVHCSFVDHATTTCQLIIEINAIVLVHQVSSSRVEADRYLCAASREGNNSVVYSHSKPSKVTRGSTRLLCTGGDRVPSGIVSEHSQAQASATIVLFPLSAVTRKLRKNERQRRGILDFS